MAGGEKPPLPSLVVALSTPVFSNRKLVGDDGPSVYGEDGQPAGYGDPQPSPPEQATVDS